MDKIESIFKVIHYRHVCDSKRKLRYPTFKVQGNDVAYFKTTDEVEKYIQGNAVFYKAVNEYCFCSDRLDLYAYVVLELPLGMEIYSYQHHHLSVRIYLPDGTLWGVQPYADFFPNRLDSEGYNAWGKRNMFWGREQDEIKFKSGNIVEILGYEGNCYWSENEVNIAVVLKTPPTKVEVTEMRKTYLDTHGGFDTCDHHLSRVFGSGLDTYEVVSFACDDIDHAPTISFFEPTKQVSSKRKKALMELYEKYKTQDKK